MSEAVGLAAEREVVVVFGWLGCALVVVGGMVEVVVAVGWVVRGRWLCFHGSCPFGSGHGGGSGERGCRCWVLAVGG